MPTHIHNENASRAQSCAVGTVDGRAARIVAGFVVALALMSLVGAQDFILGILAADFFIRAWVNRTYSPLRWLAHQLLEIANVAPKPTYAPPKLFAAQVGSVITGSAFVLSLLNFNIASLVLTAALVIAASLESIFGYCVACWLYPYIFRARAANRG